MAEGRARSLGTPGRPSPIVMTRPDGAVVLALDIEVDSLAAALIGLGGEVLEHVRMARPRGHSSLAAIVADLAELADTVRTRRTATDDLVGVGVAVAGIVRRADGLVSMAPNLGWIDQPLGDRLARGLGDDLPISVGNEADLAALAETRRGVAAGADHVVFVSGEVGVGGGLIVDGRPFTGVAGYGGEVGHLPVNPDGRQCRCGAAGCWETEVGEMALLRRAGRSADGGRSEIDALLRDAARPAPGARWPPRRAGRWLGIGLAGLINVLNPGLVVFGGLFQRIHPYVAVDRRGASSIGGPCRRPRRLVRVVPGTLGAEAPLIGAAELAFEPVLADPARWLARGERTAKPVYGIAQEVAILHRRVVA